MTFNLTSSKTGVPTQKYYICRIGSELVQLNLFVISIKYKKT